MIFQSLANIIAKYLRQSSDWVYYSCDNFFQEKVPVPSYPCILNKTLMPEGSRFFQWTLNQSITDIIIQDASAGLTLFIPLPVRLLLEHLHNIFLLFLYTDDSDLEEADNSLYYIPVKFEDMANPKSNICFNTTWYPDKLRSGCASFLTEWKIMMKKIYIIFSFSSNEMSDVDQGAVYHLLPDHFSFNNNYFIRGPDFSKLQSTLFLPMRI